MSNNAQARNQGSTVSDTGRSSKLAQASVTPQKSQGDDKAIPVKAIHFAQAVKWPGLPGAGLSLKVGLASPGGGHNTIFCDTIFLYRDEFVINGQHFMSKYCASILTYEF